MPRRPRWQSISDEDDDDDRGIQSAPDELDYWLADVPGFPFRINEGVSNPESVPKVEEHDKVVKFELLQPLAAMAPVGYAVATCLGISGSAQASVLAKQFCPCVMYSTQRARTA